MKKIISLLFLFFLFQNKFTAQTTLAPGDMSFIGFNTSGTDGVSFVTFVNLCPGTVFFFTDNPYRNSGGFCTSAEEFCIRFQVTSLIPAGTKITYTDANHPTVGTVGLSPAVGTATAAYNSTGTAGTNNGFNSGGDNCFIFQGSFAAPSFVCAFKNSGAYNASGTVSCGDRNHTELPSTLTLGQNAMVGCVNVGMRYNCSTLTGSSATLGAAINNIANWTCSGAAVALPPTCSFTVTGVPNPLPVVTASASPTTICNGSSVTLNAGGATTYTWSANAGSATTQTTSVSPNANITYTVTGGTLGCTATQTISVNVNALPSLTITAAPSIICSGLSTTLTSSGASTYTWSSNAGSVTTSTAAVTPTANTIYTVTGTSLGCSSTRTISVNVTASPSLTLATAASSICNGQSTTLTGSGASSYTWSSNAGSVTTSTAAVTPTTNTTYTVTGSTSGCTSAGTVAVNVTALPSLTLSATSSSVCSGQAATLTATGATNYTWSPNAGSVTTNTAAITPTANATYTVTGNTSGCADTRTINVNVTALPSLSLTASIPAICLGQSSVLTANGAASYTWSANAGGVITNTAIVTPTANTTYTVTGNNSGCISTGTLAVTITTSPTLSLTAASPSICSGQSTTLTGVGAISYTWSPNAGGVTTNTAIVTPTTNTTYTVTGNTAGCVSTGTIAVNVTALPSLTLAVFSSTICSGQTTTLTATGASSYTWSANTGAITTSSAAVTPTNNSTYTVTGNNAGCTSTGTISLNVTAPPSLTIAATSPSICSGQSTTITATGATSYTWSANTGSAITHTVSVSPSTTDIYTVTSNNAGCISSQIININVTATPTIITVASQTVICSGQSTTLSASGAPSYTWSANAGGANTTSVSVSPSNSTNYTVIGDNLGCTSSQIVNVNVNTTPTVNIVSTSTAVCEGNSATLTFSGASTYTVTNPSVITNSTVIVTPTTQTTYTVVGETAGCSSTAQTITINVNTIPQIAVANQTTCAGSAVTINASGTDTYTWLPSGATTNAITVSPTTSATYSVTGTNSLTGCASTLTTVNVFVNAIPTVTATANSNIVCLSGSVALNAITSASTFTWTLGNGINSGNQNQANVTLSASTLSPGVYVYTLTAASSQNCVSLPVTTSITVVDLPNAAFNLSDLSICQNQSGTLSINNPQIGTTYDWNVGGVNMSNVNPLIIPASMTSNVGSVSVNVIATMGTCTNTANNTLTITTLPTVALVNSNVSACENASTQLEVTDPNSTYTYNWLYNGQSLSNNTTVIVNSLGDSNLGTYTVTATDIYGCTNSTTGMIDIQLCETFVPEIFTPNGDGMNDGFEIKNIENYPNNTLKIFNRWGNMVYQKDRYLNEFVGYANTGDAAGQAKLPVGTYYVILNYGDDKTETYNGYLLLQY